VQHVRATRPVVELDHGGHARTEAFRLGHAALQQVEDLRRLSLTIVL
jgi:hypothetical protein